MIKITQSLIGSWDRVFSCYDEQREEYFAEFTDALRRVRKPDTDAQAEGKIFENVVQALAQGRDVDIPKGMDKGARAVADIVRGGCFQVRMQRELTIGGERYLLEGIADVMKAGTIYDIKKKVKKFSSSSVYVAGTWLSSPQHPAYFFLEPNARELIYLCSDGEDLYTERYLPREVVPFPIIAAEFIGSLKALDLYEEYKKYWTIKE